MAELGTIHIYPPDATDLWLDTHRALAGDPHAARRAAQATELLTTVDGPCLSCDAPRPERREQLDVSTFAERHATIDGMWLCGCGRRYATWPKRPKS